jgi:hypothetical protein
MRKRPFGSAETEVRIVPWQTNSATIASSGARSSLSVAFPVNGGWLRQSPMALVP